MSTKHIRFQEMIFTRSLGLLSALMAFFVCFNAVSWHLMNTNLSNMRKPLIFVNNMFQLAVLFFVLFVFVSYEMAAKLQRTDAVERLLAVKGELLRLYRSQFFLLLIPVLILCVNLILWFFAALRLQELYSNRAFGHLCLATALYCLLPSCIAILLGALLSKMKRAIAYTLIIVAAIMVSPIPLRLFSGFQIGKFPLASMLDWFALSVPDSEWLPDAVYGIPMETARWAKVFFWIFLLLFLMIWQNSRNHLKKLKPVLCVIAVLVLAAGIRFACRQNDSILYKDNRPNGLQCDLWDYYMDKTLPEERQASFAVAAYEMELNIQSNLQAKVSMTITDRESKEPLVFTLHHGLKVKSVRDTEGNALSYSRDLDYLTVDTDKTEIIVSYSGEMGMFYSNSQAIFLPGYAAYYPVPGIHHLWADNRIKPVVSTSESQFDLKVHTFQQTFSNLKEISANTFLGKSNSVGVFAGLLQKTEKENVTYLESLVLNDSSRWSLSDYNEKWNKLYEFFELSENKPLEGRMVVFLPATVLGFSSHAKYVDDGAVIYFGDLIPQPDTLACEILLSNVIKTPQNALLYLDFNSYIYSNLDHKPVSNSEKPDYNDLLIFNKVTSEFTDEDIQAYGPSRALWYQLLSYQEERLGTRVFLNNIYRYLQDPDPQQSVLDFVYFMGEESNDETD